MLSKTSISALRALIHLGQQESSACLSPRRLAEVLGESPTYLAKSLRFLVRQGILRAEKGAKGGVRLALPPDQITLLAVVEACQGTILGSYCSSPDHYESHCNFHCATLELYEAVTGVLTRWTLAHLLERPGPLVELPGAHACLIVGGTRQP